MPILLVKVATADVLDSPGRWRAGEIFGFYGLPLPRGVSANIDAFLTHHGHK